MTNIAIRVENCILSEVEGLSKLYHIGRAQSHRASRQGWGLVAWIIIANGVYLRFYWPSFMELLREVGHLWAMW